MAQVLLHGTLHVTIYAGRGIEKAGGEKKHHRIGNFFRSFLEGAEDAIVGGSQYYATVDLGDARVGRTQVLKASDAEPVWNESFRIYCCHTVSDLTVSVKDASVPGTVVVGRAKLQAEDLLSGEPVDNWYQLMKDDDQAGEIRFNLQFYEASHDPHWGEGVADPRFKGVPYCYYPQRKGCKVTLYQDAHMVDGFEPPIYLAGGQLRQPTHCWEDVFTAINDARHIVYITGWSVYCEILLVRDPNRPVPESAGVTLGELLKKKAAEGVRVNLLVWDDKTSVEILHKDGLMATHDEDTEAYFEGSQVNCKLCPRNPDASLTIVQGLAIGNMFTHHQKTIIVDAALPGADTGRRRIMSFVGGIDLCDGRYDNQNHSLFRTLNDLNMNDFHQPNYPGTSTAKGGPREPWHDIHSRLEGPIAWDVLWNFEQRWKKQAKPELLIPIKDIDSIDPPSAVTEEDDPDTWTVQLFRSIDAGAAFGFPEDDPEAVARAGLTSLKDNTIDRSIQDAYINAIRRAKNFLYIENQYFLGSCFAWKESQDAGALHLIPMEITRKICSKIEDGERFACYIVVPMWPEGIPESGSVQAILDWQHNTMEMMYTEIATSIRAAGVDAHPRDYLTFFCLGNRETKQPGELEPTEHPDPGSNYEAAQEHRRFMIYVHAKMLIADDEYTIIGSANINQRSMDGARDTEIAMGAYQPYHLCAQKPPRSHIHGFRMSLWYEHIGRLDNDFLQPWTLDCIRKVNEAGDRYWALWAGEEVVDMPGHLLTYPVLVDQDGTVGNIPGLEHFPDTQAKILGTKSDTLPSILTT